MYLTNIWVLDGVKIEMILPLWQRIAEVPGKELWEVHLVLKRKFMGYLREKVRSRWVEGSNDPTQVLTSGTLA